MDADLVLKTIEADSHHRFLPIVGSKKGAFLVRQLRHYQPKKVVEVGALVGYGAILIAQALSEAGHLWTLEIDADLAIEAQRNLERANLSKKVTLVVGNALETIPTLPNSIDFAFLDARKDEYLGYLKLLEPKLATKAAILADNAGIFANEMAEYLAYVRTSGNYQSSFHKFGDDGMELSLWERPPTIIPAGRQVGNLT